MFDVCQGRCGMKVGTDGVLLGAWARGGRSILDIGTGTGLIALMMAQRFAEARVTAIDIDVEACAQAEENIQNSSFASRIDVEASPLQDFSCTEKFDSVVSNPPFFVDSLRNPDSRRSVARHADTLSYRDLFRGVVSLISDDGEFSAVIPAECLSRFVAGLPCRSFDGSTLRRAYHPAQTCPPLSRSFRLPVFTVGQLRGDVAEP